MIITPHNWAELQHYKDRSPPWIKLHKKLLDNFEWHSLPVASRALAPMLWLLASEHEGGEIDAAPKKLAFRLRMSEREATEALTPLIDNDFFIVVRDDSGALAGCKQVADPEAEKRKRREEAEQKARDFEEFWKAYPKKDAKKDALTAWAKVRAPLATLLEAIERKRGSEEWTKSRGQFVPLPSTWLNGKRWEDAASDNAAVSHIWHESAAGVKAKAAELDLDPQDEVMEPFPMFRARVMKAAEAHA